MSLKQNIYLAGTIYNDSIHANWKNIFNDSIDKEFFSTFDPAPDMEPKSFDTVARDKQIIDRSQIIVAYIAKITVGTTMEIFYAHTNGKIVYIIDATEDNRLQNDLWLSAHCHRFFNHQNIDSVVTDCAHYINEYMKKYI